MPRPEQCGQAPCGLLKEKARGSNSSNDSPVSGSASFSEKKWSGPSTSAAIITPSPWRKRGLHAVRQARAEALRGVRVFVVADNETVHDDLDRMLLVLGEVDLLIEVAHRAIDAHADEARPLRLLEDALMLPFAVPDDGRENEDARAIREVEDMLDDLLGALLLDRPAGRRAVRVADAGEEQAQIVVDFRHGADGRTRVAAGALLVNRDRRGEAVDMIDIRLLHQAEELPGIGGERFDVPPLPFRIDSIEGEA